MDNQDKTPQEVASRLDISPSTLRRWSDEFMEFLSDGATSLSGKTHRRYTTQDVERLESVKDFMVDGMTYEQTRQQLRQELEFPASTASIITNDDAMAANTVMGYISETVENVRQGQMSVLNSQAANRELMGVVIQDNFNLKEENNRLRERMLELERQLGDIRKDETSRRESLRQEMEMKLAEVREIASSRSQPVTILENRPGCLGNLFGGGSQAQGASPQTSYPPQSSAAASPPPPSFPRPPGPPE